ncbi:MAG: aminotransferase class V-fold PLP-dependent enzyme [Saprospiraceae bacterium]|nr:aminotransferase class V-fold PLP-dependent enzyme [Saprospiraceae bacterium]
MKSEDKKFKNLDMSPEEFRKLGYHAIDMITEYYKKLDDLDVFPGKDASEIESEFNDELPRKPQDPGDIIDEWKNRVIPNATHLGSRRFFGFVNGSGTMIGTLAEALSSAVNMNQGGWKASPSATEIERRTIKWIAEMIGYHSDSGGLITSGGTMANMTALETALRNLAPYDTSHHGLQKEGFDQQFKVYMSDHEGHVSIVRVTDLLNLGRKCIQRIKSNSDFSMNSMDLERQIKEDISNGNIPLCVVAQVGSINVGVIDPLEEIGRICQKYKIWFHADGACGALGAMLPEKKDQYRGMEMADSVTLDPHKWLYIPYECGCVLVKDKEKLRRAFSLSAPYLRGSIPRSYDGENFWEYGPQMSRGFKALKLWMSLKYFGVNGYRRLLYQNVRCVEHLDQMVRRSDDFQELHKPNLLMYCFRYAPQEFIQNWKGSEEDLESYLDDVNQEMADEIMLSGLAFIMTSKIYDRVVLRLSICSHRTTLEDIDTVFEKLKELGAQILLNHRST